MDFDINNWQRYFETKIMEVDGLVKQGAFSDARKILDRLLEVCDCHKDSTYFLCLRGSIIGLIGFSYFEEHQHAEAHKNYEESFRIAAQYQDTDAVKIAGNRLIQNFIGWGDYYVKNSELHLALKKYKAGLVVAESLYLSCEQTERKRYGAIVVDLHIAIGDIYDSENMVKKAEESFCNACLVAQQQDLTEHKIKIILATAFLPIFTKDIILKDCQIALEKAKEKRLTAYIPALCNTVGKILYSNGDYEKAFDFLDNALKEILQDYKRNIAIRHIIKKFYSDIKELYVSAICSALAAAGDKEISDWYYKILLISEKYRSEELVYQGIKALGRIFWGHMMELSEIAEIKVQKRIAFPEISPTVLFFSNFNNFIEKLKTENDPLTRHIRSRLSSVLESFLNCKDEDNNFPYERECALLTQLNKIIQCDCLFDLSGQPANMKQEEIIDKNREALEDAYPEAVFKWCSRRGKRKRDIPIALMRKRVDEKRYPSEDNNLYDDFDIEKITKIIDESTVVISFLCLEKTVLVLVFFKQDSKVEFLEKPSILEHDKNEINRIVNKFHKHINQYSDLVPKYMNDENILSTMSEDHQEDLEEFYDVLEIERILKSISEKFCLEQTTLLIEADEFLHGIPFHALCDGDRYLYEKVTGIHSCISLRSLGICLENKDFGDFLQPHLGKEISKFKQAVSSNFESSEQFSDKSYPLDCMFFGAPGEFQWDKDGKLLAIHDFLPGVIEEARSLEKILGSENVTCFGYGDLEKHRALIDNLRKYHHGGRILYISAHGDSGILLLNNIMTDEHILEEIIWDFRRHVTIILSCCFLGRMKPIGMEMEGMINSFHSKGATSIVSALWDVDDAATSILMPKFVEYLKENLEKQVEHPRSCALKSAMNYLRNLDNGKYDVPYFWAPFFISGIS